MTGFNHSGIDSSLGMQTPEGIEFVLFPAAYPIRVCAWMIDSLIKGAALFGLFMAITVIHAVLGWWFFLLLNFVLDWFYFTGFEIFWNGQTPGKRIMGIRVVKSGGSPVDPGASFLRNLLRFADTFFFLYLIAFIAMTASRGFRRFGDWAGDTLVVYTARSRLSGRFTPPALAKQQAIPWLADIPRVLPGRALSYEEKQGLLMFARRYPLLGRERADEIARPWADQLGRSGGVSASEYLLGIAHTISGAA